MKKEQYEKMIVLANDGNISAIQNLAKWGAYRVVRQIFAVTGNEYIRKVLYGENKSMSMEDLQSVATIALLECFRANYMHSKNWLDEPIFRPIVKFNKQCFVLFENAIKYVFWCVRKAISNTGIDVVEYIFIDSLETLCDNGFEIPVLISGKRFEQKENLKLEKFVNTNISKLTKRQTKILKYKLQNLSNRKIAEIMKIGYQTVQNELNRIAKKFDITYRKI